MMTYRKARTCWSIATALVVAALAAGSGLAAKSTRPALLVLGAVHFANPGRDLVNVTVEDVLTPARQREIAAVVDRLAAFHPTHVAVEWPAANQAKLDERYAAYRAGRFTLTANERDQIGLRLAAKLGLARVDAIDWSGDAPGKDSDYDFPGWMKGQGRTAEWDAFVAGAQRDADAIAAHMRCRSVGDWFRHLADPAQLAEAAAPNYSIAAFGDATENRGAAWVGTWYARNLRIYANLLRIAAKPGDRTIAVFGQGHAPLLRDYAGQSGSFSIVDPRVYLPPPGKPRC